jgi:hypothetical protein
VGQPDRDRRADAPAAAGHEGYPATEVGHLDSLSVVITKKVS